MDAVVGPYAECVTHRELNEVYNSGNMLRFARLHLLTFVHVARLWEDYDIEDGLRDSGVYGARAEVEGLLAHTGFPQRN